MPEGVRRDLRFYGTSDAVDDLDAVREALGYDGLHLYGGSYGVVAAQAAQADPAATARQSAGTYLETFMARASVEIEVICGVTPPLADLTALDAPVRSTVPALIAMGAQDPKLPATTIVGMKAAMPNARVAVVHTAGHGTIGTGASSASRRSCSSAARGAALDTACARRQSFPPFVLRWSDWERLDG